MLVTRNRWLSARPAASPLVLPHQLALKRLRACSQHSARPYARLSRRTAGSWLVLQLRRWSRLTGWSYSGFALARNTRPVLMRACHAEPLAPGLSCSSATGLTPPAGPTAASLATLGPSLCVLVTQNRWLLACPAASPLVSPHRLVLKRLRACSQHSACPYACLSRRTGLRHQIPWCCRSSRAPSASLAPPVVSRADSFLSSTGRLARRQLP